MAELHQSKVDRAWSESGDDSRASDELPAVPAPLVPWVPSLVSPPPLPRPPAVFAEATSTFEPLRIPSLAPRVRDREDATLLVRPLVDTIAAPRRTRPTRAGLIAGLVAALAAAVLALVLIWPERQSRPPVPAQAPPASASPPSNASPPTAPQLAIKHTASATKTTKAPVKKKTAAKKAPPKKTAAKHTSPKQTKAKGATKAKSAGKATSKPTTKQTSTAKPKAKPSSRKT